jgi:enediyne polyketide synthase
MWMAKLREQYFFSLVPQVYRANGRLGVLKCLSCSIHHLREGMPFDVIHVTMGLKALYENGVDLSFEFFREDAQGSNIKLAYGDHRAVWMTKDQSGRSSSRPMPQEISEPLLAATRVLSPA